MASLFDQYEQASSRRQVAPQARQGLHAPIATGFINARLEDDTPIFNKQRISFNPPDPICHLCVCNSFLVMAMSSNILLRIDLEQPDNPDEVEIPKSVEDKVHKMFLDPTGRHLLISMKSSENYYLSRNSKKPKQLGKLKGHNIESVAWNKSNTNETTTGPILLGTNKGLIFETEVAAGEDSRFFQGSLEQYWKQLFNLGKERAVPITGLELERIPTNSSMVEQKYFIMATTPGRMYQFLGPVSQSVEPPIFGPIFAQYEDIPERFLELPGNFGYSKLKFYHPKYRATPKAFAWMTGPGVYFGNIDISGAAGQDSVTTETKLMSYPRDDGERPVPPLGIVLTEFHVLILFPDRLKAVCTLNDQLIYDDIYTDRFGRLLGMVKDPMKGTVWAYTSQAVFKYKIVREARDVWQMYLDKGEFDLAKEFCKDNPANMDKVLTKQADDFYKNGSYDKSAIIYASTQNSFEEIALKFIQVEERSALKTFLLKKLQGLKPQDKTQMTMIVTWLIEIYLNQLGQLKEEGQDMSSSYDALQEEFRKFLAQTRVKDCVNYNRNTIYDLIASHGDVEDMVFFAVLMQDLERVISHHIQHENYRAALEVLTKQSDVELFYKFSPLMMQHIPKETVDAWISMGKKLEPKKLIPALVQYDHQKYRTQGNEAIRYLEFCVQMLDIKDQAIHNYLLSLYSKLQPEQLMTYLNFQGQDADTVCYDLKYGLRLCAEYRHQRACVHIYTTMELFEEAVDLALKVDVDLAKQNADKPDNDEELRKKLWLRIARHVVEEEKDIKRAMEFLHECDLLKIEDILPFFPDFVTIDHFKDAICTSLQEYNQHIDSLKEEMEEATQSAKEIRGEIQTFRNKYGFVKSQDKCSCCGFPLLTRNFYLFPCKHRFHGDCLISEVVPQLSSSKRMRVEELQRKLASNEEPSTNSANGASMAGVPRRDQSLKEDLDELIAGECIYCGDFMIKSVDRPFLAFEEYDQVMQSWL